MLLLRPATKVLHPSHVRPDVPSQDAVLCPTRAFFVPLSQSCCGIGCVRLFLRQSVAGAVLHQGQEMGERQDIQVCLEPRHTAAVAKLPVKRRDLNDHRERDKKLSLSDLKANAPWSCQGNRHGGRLRG